MRKSTRGVAALAFFLAIIVAFVAVAAARPTVYTARMSLVALPAAGERNEVVAGQYGEVVSLGLPALSELARSPSVLANAVSRVPGADPESIAQSVSVDLVPGSGVGRVSVDSEDVAVSSGMVRAIADQVIAANLLSPAAQLRLLDPRPEVIENRPLSATTVGLALLAGLVGAVAVWVASGFVPSAPRRRPVPRSGGEGGDEVDEVVTLDADDEELGERLRELHTAAGKPLSIVAVGRQLRGSADALSAMARDRGVPVAEDEDVAGPRPVVVAVQGSDGGDGELARALGKVSEPDTLVAIVRCRQMASPHGTSVDPDTVRVRALE